MKFEPYSLAFTIDPQPTFTRFREQAPICYLSDHDGWLLTRHRDIVEVLSSDAYSSDRALYAANQARPVDRLPTPYTDQFLATVPFLHENPSHQATRRVLAKVFSARNMVRWQGVIDRIVEASFAPLRDHGTAVEFHQLVKMIPNTVMTQMLGMNGAGYSQSELQVMLDNFSHLTEPNPTPEMSLAIEQAINTTRLMLTDHIAVRRSTPGDDLTTLCIEAAAAEQLAFTEEMMVAVLQALFLVGSDTTMYQMLMCIWTLLQNPSIVLALRRGETDLDAVFYELLRYQNVSKVTVRYARRDTLLSGEAISRGSMVYLPVGAANWDPEVVSKPEVFDPGHHQKSLIPFGKGVHFCVGSQLAKLEIVSVLRQLVEHLPVAFEFDPASVVWHPETLSGRQIRVLPIRLLRSR